MAGSVTNSKTKRIAAAAAAAASIAAGFEGVRQYAYYDARPGNPILTVCYGSTTQVQRGKKYSMEECKQRLDADMLKAVNAVDSCHPNLPFSVLVAFSDAAYNIGPRVACNGQASRYLSQGKYDNACTELTRWNKSNGVVLSGLTKRREAEYKLCTGDN